MAGRLLVSGLESGLESGNGFKYPRNLRTAFRSFAFTSESFSILAILAKFKKLVLVQNFYENFTNSLQ